MEAQTSATATASRQRPLAPQTPSRAARREAARQAAERRRVLAEIAVMLRSSPFVDVEG